jgi:hypothetical protein
MSLTKTDIVQIVTKKTGLPKNKSVHAVEWLLEIVPVRQHHLEPGAEESRIESSHSQYFAHHATHPILFGRPTMVWHSRWIRLLSISIDATKYM